MQNNYILSRSEMHPEPCQSHSIPPNWGARCHRDPKFNPVTTKLPKESFDPKIEI